MPGERIAGFAKSWFPGPNFARRAVRWAAWGYLASVVLLWIVMRWAGDRWWFGTLLLFGPRWLCLLPLVALVPLALFLRRRSVWPLAAALVVAVGPVAGFRIPWTTLLASDTHAIRLLTCNVKGHCDKNDRLDALIRESNPDIVALQGCWNESHLHWPDGWHVLRDGELIVASRFPLREIARSVSARPDHGRPREILLACVVTLPESDLRFATVHLQSPHYGISRVLDRTTGIRPSRSDLLVEETEARWQESEDVSRQLANDCRPDIVVGDLNLPVESPIYRTYWSPWKNAFSDAGWGLGGTEWPPGMAGIPFGVRIDHVLSNSQWRAKRCWLGPDVMSDHLPLLADLQKE